jgi:hypothetical protein
MRRGWAKVHAIPPKVSTLPRTSRNQIKRVGNHPIPASSGWRRFTRRRKGRIPLPTVRIGARGVPSALLTPSRPLRTNKTAPRALRGGGDAHSEPLTDKTSSEVREIREYGSGETHLKRGVIRSVTRLLGDVRSAMKLVTHPFRDVHRAFKNVPRPFRNGPRPVRNVPRAFKNVLRSFRNVPSPSKNVHYPFRNVTRPRMNVTLPIGNVLPAFWNLNRHFRNVPRTLIPLSAAMELVTDRRRNLPGVFRILPGVLGAVRETFHSLPSLPLSFSPSFLGGMP